jgi:hypothetical protein
MIVLPSTSAGIQSSSLVGESTFTINPPNTVFFLTIKANTPLSIANIVGANPSWADPAGNFNDYFSFYTSSKFDNIYLQGIYGDLGAGFVWIDSSDFATDITNTIVPSNYNYIVIQPYAVPATIPLLNGNLGINKMFA